MCREISAADVSSASRQLRPLQQEKGHLGASPAPKAPAIQAWQDMLAANIGGSGSGSGGSAPTADSPLLTLALRQASRPMLALYSEWLKTPPTPAMMAKGTQVKAGRKSGVAIIQSTLLALLQMVQGHASFMSETLRVMHSKAVRAGRPDVGDIFREWIENTKDKYPEDGTSSSILKTT